MNKINVTDARKEMSNFFDSVIFEKPIILKRRKSKTKKFKKIFSKKIILAFNFIKNIYEKRS